ncbi:hypothetical protein J6590_011469 [Homalodisca vitripennis]|nr:hypothetical protein J6590_011469 [Homalodisca vitripennis]
MPIFDRTKQWHTPTTNLCLKEAKAQKMTLSFVILKVLLTTKDMSSKPHRLPYSWILPGKVNFVTTVNDCPNRCDKMIVQPGPSATDRISGELP